MSIMFVSEGMEKMPRTYPADLPDSQEEVYRTVGDVELKINTYTPEGHAAIDRRPAIVFFLGSGFRQGSRAQYEHQCAYFASRGIEALSQI